MKNILFIFGFIFILLSCSNSQTKEEKVAPATQTQNPFDLKLPSLDKKLYSLNDFKNKVILLNFFATWCPYCKKEVIELNKLNKEIKNKNFILIGIDIGEGAEKVKRFAEKHNINYTILLDRTGYIAKFFGIRGIPTNFILDKNKSIVFSSHIPPEINEIKKHL